MPITVSDVFSIFFGNLEVKTVPDSIVEPNRNALDYVKTRVQGRDIAGRVDGDVTIINHPDVRRMLLWIKTAVDGIRSMAYTATYREDLAHGLPPGTEKAHFRNLIDFMTPILKAYG